MDENIVKNTGNDNFAWMPFYMEFADKLVAYYGDRTELIEKIKNVYDHIDMKLPKLEENNELEDIDPFTIYGLFNKGITNKNRIKILTGFAEEFNIKTEVPKYFDGVPVLMNMSATFYNFKSEREHNAIENLWQVFLEALKYADGKENQPDKLIEKYNIAIKQKGVKWNLTVGLYWIRPNTFINLDSRNRWFLLLDNSMPESFKEKFGKLDDLVDGETYFKIIEYIKNEIKSVKYSYHNFAELSYKSWEVSENVNKGGTVEETLEETRSVHYWAYAPGDGANMWDEFYNKGIMAIGWGILGDLKKYASKDEMKKSLKELYNPEYTYKNAAHATWQFANEIKKGDIIIVKKGMHKIVGKGIVVSDYYFDETREDNYKNIIDVNWVQIGEWDTPVTFAVKTLTDITPYTNDVTAILSVFEEEAEVEAEEEREIKYDKYDKDDFLKDVYIDEDDYKMLVNLLEYKQNIILKGAPGVGKTYAARKLAYSIIGEKNPERVSMIQFHQSYSYEDFIVSLRPNSKGIFEIKYGPFYEFCKKAELDDKNNPYFFIIDEINRGNLSKIFGELFMLIEKNKREVGLQLLYSNEKFTVPENVYIIGMMNTADRSLALLDYALRRRFAFYELEPALDNEKFKAYVDSFKNEKFNKLIEVVRQLNIEITNDDTLGKGFCIGHSYFCEQEKIDDMWLEGVVNYELIPLIEEYWFDEKSKINKWSDNLKGAIR